MFDWLVGVLHWLEEAGAVGILVYAGVFLIWGLALPTSVFIAAAGYIWGLWWGAVITAVVTTVAAGVAFALARAIGGGWIERIVERHPTIAALRKVGGKGGFRLVTVVRLSPGPPFSLVNYAFALSRVGFWQFVLGSLVGQLPQHVMYVYLGTLVPHARALVEGELPDLGVWDTVMTVAGALVIVGVTWWGWREMKRVKVSQPSPGSSP